MAHVCFMSIVVTVWGSVGMFVVYLALLKIMGLEPWIVEVCDGYCVFCLNYEARSCRCSCMGSVSVSSCRFCMFVSCVHPVAVLNAAFCMTFSLLMLVEEVRGDHMEEVYSRAGLMTVLKVPMSVFFCFPHAVSVVIICRGLCACTEML